MHRSWMAWKVQHAHWLVNNWSTSSEFHLRQCVVGRLFLRKRLHLRTLFKIFPKIIYRPLVNKLDRDLRRWWWPCRYFWILMPLITCLEKHGESMKNEVYSQTYGLRLFRELRGSGYKWNTSILHVSIIISTHVGYN